MERASMYDLALDALKKQKEIEKLELDISQAKSELDSLKKRKEIDKIEIDISNASTNVRIQQLKAWAALLAPLMTAVTILGTVYIGYLQIRTKSDADDDSNWRQTITAIKRGSSLERASSKRIGTLLSPFLESPRYRTRAIGVTIDELPKLRDEGTFKELFSAAFPRAEPKDLPALLDLNRTLWAEYKIFPSSSGNSSEQDVKKVVDPYCLHRAKSCAILSLTFFAAPTT
jgi:hypothetical protein